MTRAAAAAVLSSWLAGAALAADVRVHHDTRVWLDPATGEISIDDVIRLPDRGRQIITLADWLTVDSARLGSRPVDVRRSDDGWQVLLPPEDEQPLTLRVSGRLPPLPANGRPRTAGGVSGAEGSYLPGYAGWLPRIGDGPISYRLRVATPLPYRAVATGRLTDEAENGDTYSATFTAENPTEPPSLFAGPFDVTERQHGDIRLRTYLHPELAGLADDYLATSAAYIDRFAAAIGPYPFDDFHIFSAPLPVGLGFPNLTYVGRRVLPLPFMRGRSLAHEILHNWWGNGVAVNYADGNWAEGLTTYMADYAVVADRGVEAAREMRLGWLRDYAALPAARDMPVTRFTAKRHDAAQVVGYNKVAFIFHMLRQEIGETAFTAALKQFWQDRQFETASWDDLRAAFERASGWELAWFFDQWLDRAGAPRIELDTVDVAENDGVHSVTVTLRQGRPAYRLRVPVVVDTAAGMERRQMRLTGPVATATLTLDARPLAIHVDPDHNLFRRLLPGESPPIIRDVTLDADSRTLILTDDDETAATARRLAERLMDTPPRLIDAETRITDDAPLLIIGTAARVQPVLQRAGLAERHDKAGTARAWTARRENGQPVLIVTAADGTALAALLRPLPHYGRKSYAVFQGRRAIDTGIWPVPGSPLRRVLSD